MRSCNRYGESREEPPFEIGGACHHIADGGRPGSLIALLHSVGVSGWGRSALLSLRRAAYCAKPVPIDASNSVY
jgi:hypothetical protein